MTSANRRFEVKPFQGCSIKRVIISPSNNDLLARTREVQQTNWRPFFNYFEYLHHLQPFLAGRPPMWALWDCCSRPPLVQIPWEYTKDSSIITVLSLLSLAFY